VAGEAAQRQRHPGGRVGERDQHRVARAGARRVDVRRAGAGYRVLAKEGDRGQEFAADAVVVAVPHQAAAALLAELPVPGVAQWRRLSAAPIVNVHLHYDRPVTGLRMAAVLDSPLQWVFDRTAVAGAPRGQYLAVSLSAAHEHLDVRTADLRARFVPAVQQLFPRARQARLLDFFVTREPHATFRQAPGTAALRPDSRTPLPGLVLAGAWTGTGWPDTTEGAVRSGARAAAVVAADLHRRQSVEVTA
ncbi:FAD-dependent oxidoreductase, partial [Saccharopolyspora hordei]|uniref:FAD-dependent oxidoreductase n=1 Tax=Saccharopolyspora hordei TaxID=1838 RepID=UPI0035EB9A30